MVASLKSCPIHLESRLELGEKGEEKSLTGRCLIVCANHTDSHGWNRFRVTPLSCALPLLQLNRPVRAGMAVLRP